MLGYCGHGNYYEVSYKSNIKSNQKSTCAMGCKIKSSIWVIVIVIDSNHNYDVINNAFSCYFHKTGQKTLNL